MPSDDTKAIIIAAGLSSRLRPYTDTLPKCMLPMGERTILEGQIATFKKNGITDITVVRGYKKEKINYPGVTYFDNDAYESNNILNSLFYAESKINGHVVISYSDIVFEHSVVDTLIQSKKDISIVVDTDWESYYEGRLEHPIDEAENVIFDASKNVSEIGKNLSHKDGIEGEFIGMLKLTPEGAEEFKRYFHECKKQFWGKPFQRAATFEKAYLTDIFQSMIQSGITVNAVCIEQGWKEIDTVEDYDKAVAALKPKP